MNEPPIEAEVTTMALEGFKRASTVNPEKEQITPAQAKIEAIASLTLSAYQKAGQLALTQEEIERLQADFPDDAFRPGAAGKEELIYIEHAYLRERLNQVVGPGQWSIVPRSRWAEDYEYFNTRSKTKETATRVYVEAMLIIRGCFVAESIGDMTYYKNNQATNYGDAVEGAKSSALRRCAKELGIGLQAWKKDWCESWWKRRNSPKSNAVAPRSVPDDKKVSEPVQTTKTAPSANADPNLGVWLSKCRLELLQRLEPMEREAHEYAQKHGLCLPNEGLHDVEIGKLFPSVDYSLGVEGNKSFVKQDFERLTKAIERFAGGEVEPKIEVPRDQHLDPNNPDALWRSFPLPFGKQAGKKLADLDKAVLFGWWANFKVEKEYMGKRKKPETIAKDQTFREMLDEAGKHYEFNLPEDNEGFEWESK